MIAEFAETRMATASRYELLSSSFEIAEVAIFAVAKMFNLKRDQNHGHGLMPGHDLAHRRANNTNSFDEICNYQKWLDSSPFLGLSGSGSVCGCGWWCPSHRAATNYTRKCQKLTTFHTIDFGDKCKYFTNWNFLKGCTGSIAALKKNLREKVGPLQRLDGAGKAAIAGGFADDQLLQPSAGFVIYLSARSASHSYRNFYVSTFKCSWQTETHFVVG